MRRQHDREWMARAIELARPHATHPNPRVGAVVLGADGEVAGEGAHPGAGSPHAEALALDAAGRRAAGGTLFVTLEPCAHHGLTPPCADRVVEAGIARAVVAVLDPDRRVGGRGVEQLREAGIEVEVGLLAAEAEALDPGYFHHRRTGRPRVTLKSALTLDGQIAAADRTSKWITGEAARIDGHRLRAEADAVLVGAGTARDDDPRLTVRLEGFRGRQPRPVLILGSQPAPPALELLSRDAIVVAPRPIELGVETIVTASNGDGRVDLDQALGELGRRGIVDLLVEGGAQVAGSLLRQGLVDRGVFYLAAKLGGGVGLPAVGGSFATLADAQAVEIVGVERIGEDLRVEWVRRAG